MNLTEVILEDGKVIHSQEEFSENEFRMPDGNYPIVRKTPLDLTITNKGKKVLELKGKMDAEVLIPAQDVWRTCLLRSISISMRKSI